MKTLKTAVFICFLFIVSCAADKGIAVKERIDPKKLRSYLEDKLYDIGKLIMDDETELTEADTIARAKEVVNTIKEHISESENIINEYAEKSDDLSYMEYIKTVECTYTSLAASYAYMTAVLDNEDDIGRKEMEDLIYKMRENAVKIFMRDMDICINQGKEEDEEEMNENAPDIEEKDRE